MIVLIALAVVVAAGAYASYRGYQSSVSQSHGLPDPAHHPADFVGTTDPNVFNTNNYIGIVADVRSVAPDSQTAELRLRFIPNGSLGDPTNTYVKTPVTVFVLGGVAGSNGASPITTSAYSFPKDQEMPAIDVTMDLQTSDAPKYPFDTYTGALAIRVARNDGTGTLASFLVTRNTAAGWTISKGFIPGFYPKDTIGVSIDIHRASDTQLYAIFIMAMMWALTLAGVVMALMLIRSKNHPIGADHLTYLAALLFAFPLIRTLLPGNPPLGILADFAAFFWVEVVVGMTLLALLITWISRERRLAKEESAPTAPEAGEPPEAALP